MKIIMVIVLSFVPAVVFAQTPTPAPASTDTHAIVKVAEVAATPVTHPKRTLKAILGSVLFGVENVVDVAHGGLVVADKVLDVVSLSGKVPALDILYSGVGIAATDSGKLDTWLERQEDYLFGTHN